ncbi:hypothetical protein F4824DRAFT_455220 [Ustulina deusta]|nr:hypothetical protein F4824DRAFT_455220 [Ustulina deusta]
MFFASFVLPVISPSYEFLCPLLYRYSFPLHSIFRLVINLSSFFLIGFAPGGFPNFLLIISFYGCY